MTALLVEESSTEPDLFGFAPAERGTAVFSRDRAYRYLLTRTWDPALPVLVWVGLNPSKAGASEDDPTVCRIRSFSQSNGYGGCAVVNLFALVSTDPAGLLSHPSPVGDDTDRLLVDAARGSDVVCCWGSSVPRAASGRVHGIMDLLRTHGRHTLALAVNTDGNPKHPLYVRGDTPLRPYDGPPPVVE